MPCLIHFLFITFFVFLSWCCPLFSLFFPGAGSVLAGPSHFPDIAYTLIQDLIGLHLLLICPGGIDFLVIWQHSNGVDNLFLACLETRVFVKRMPVIDLIDYHNGEWLHLHIRTCNRGLLHGVGKEHWIIK